MRARKVMWTAAPAGAVQMGNVIIAAATTPAISAGMESAMKAMKAVIHAPKTAESAARIAKKMKLTAVQSAAKMVTAAFAAATSSASIAVMASVTKTIMKTAKAAPRIADSAPLTAAMEAARALNHAHHAQVIVGSAAFPTAMGKSAAMMAAEEAAEHAFLPKPVTITSAALQMILETAPQEVSAAQASVQTLYADDPHGENAGMATLSREKIVMTATG